MLSRQILFQFGEKLLRRLLRFCKINHAWGGGNRMTVIHLTYIKIAQILLHFQIRISR